MCPNRLFKFRHYLCDNAESDSIPTLFREASNVGLGYTLLDTVLCEFFTMRQDRMPPRGRKDHYLPQGYLRGL